MHSISQNKFQNHILRRSLGGGEDKESCASVLTMMMLTHVQLIDLKRWFIECHIFMPKKAFDYGKTEIYKIIHVDPDINLSYVGHTTNFVQRAKNTFVQRW